MLVQVTCTGHLEENRDISGIFQESFRDISPFLNVAFTPPCQDISCLGREPVAWCCRPEWEGGEYPKVGWEGKVHLRGHFIFIFWTFGSTGRMGSLNFVYRGGGGGRGIKSLTCKERGGRAILCILYCTKSTLTHSIPLYPPLHVPPSPSPESRS